MVDLSKLDFSSEAGLWASIKRVYKTAPVEVQAATFKDLKKHINWNRDELDRTYLKYVSKDYVTVAERLKQRKQS